MPPLLFVLRRRFVNFEGKKQSSLSLTLFKAQQNDEIYFFAAFVALLFHDDEKRCNISAS